MSRDFTDDDRADFLDAIDGAHFIVTQWEAKFIESNLGRKFFSEKQRESIDRMIEKYRTMLNW